MEVVKILNSSVVLARRGEDDKEIIVMGKGIGFKSKPGDIVSDDEIEKVYVLENETISSDLTALMKETPKEYLILADEIISYAKHTLSRHLSDHLYVSLTDHLYMATKRFRDNMTIQNRMLWEVKKFYPQEFSIGMHGLSLIHNQIGLSLPEEEAANIAFHLVNAQQNDDNMNQVMLMTNTVKDVLNIIKIHYQVELDTHSINYSRFLTHLQFFIQRLFEHKTLNTQDHELFDQIASKYPQEEECVLLIKEYIEARFEHTISSEEMMYLIIHINRVMSRN
ncbi:antitermination protein BlgG [Chryseobacterium mucoviscidosis]|uniref:PRD domain-containing protein n=1 Tax=Paenibacillus vandeheii TaxID=3035917 RepID=A0ABT8J9T2_9BACL|nr:MULTISPECIES: PRD domain-containing protein [Paenibacillus]MDN4601868.1 PRD domain-containing protein [Paenibacillus vandeheii]OPG96081.1 antitermination protein BlgG [Chryseobacterium mucoviscidosis]OZQ72218.1 antitermination protein BlgG [Paenibacillus taichungensis]HBU80113.1 PRD domain-containing protein [Paenibacillus sp.]